MDPSALGLMSEAIDALIRADAARLRRLAEQVPKLPLPAAGQERESVMEKRQVLATLLALTQRNLRLLRCSPDRPEEYGPERGSGSGGNFNGHHQHSV
jgi:hypothetical protein